MKSPKQNLPEEIKAQQNQSWQIEILIASGLIIFLYSLPDYLLNLLIEVQEKKIPGAEEAIIFIGGYVFARILLIGFIVVLFLRALWVAYLGVNSAFPNGINAKKLMYSSYFLKRIKKEKSLTERIVFLEKLCSLTFSVTIILTVLSVGLFAFLFLVFYLIDLLIPSVSNPRLGFLLLFVVLFIELGVLDWIMFGWLRKYPIFSKLYFPVHKVLKWLTLTVLFDKEYLSIFSNVKRWKVFGIFVVYFFVSLVISVSGIKGKFNAASFVPSFSVEQRNFLQLPTLLKIKSINYENQLNSKSRIIRACIQSDVINDNFLKLFVVYLKYFDSQLDSLFRENGVKLTLNRRTLQMISENDSLIQKSISQFFSLYLDLKPVETNKWYFARHYLTNEEGFLTYMPLQSLKKGMHKLDIYFWEKRDGKMRQRFLDQIEFYLNKDLTR